MRKKLVYITLISVIIFFAISFITVLLDFATPFWEPSDTISVGFPFTYYEEFYIDFKHHGWNLPYLLIDGILVWIVVFVIWKFKKPYVHPHRQS